MPSLNFKPQFVEAIRARTKKHTIRAPRVIPVKVGDKLFLFSGLRHRGAYRILTEAVICSQIQEIVIGKSDVTIDGQLCSPDECQRLANADGFDDFETMLTFWEGKLPFTGHIIHWKERQ